MTIHRRRPTDGRDKIRCDCGRVLASRMLRKHRKSTGHRQFRRLRALLNKPCLTYIEIGRRLGLTRERIRQFVRDMDLIALPPGKHQRTKICTINRALKQRQRWLENEPRFSSLQKCCTEMGVSFQTVPARTSLGFDRRHVTINGRLCLILRAAPRSKGMARGINIPRPTAHRRLVKVYLYYITNDPLSRWLVIPKRQAPKKQTVFHIDSADKDWTSKIEQRGFRNLRPYINAWHLLK